MTRIIGTGAMALALVFVLLTCASGQDKIAADLETARAGFAKQLEDAQKKFLAAIDAEIAKAAKSGSLETVKSLQQEKLAIEANFEHDSKVTRLRPTVARYRAEVNAAKDKLKVSLSNAVAAYTKELKIAQAESVDAELKSLNETKKPPMIAKPAVSRTAADVNVNNLKNGMVVSLFNRLSTQRDNEGFVDPSKLGTPAADPIVTESIEDWSYDSEKNAVAFGYQIAATTPCQGSLPNRLMMMGPNPLVRFRGSVQSAPTIWNIAESVRQVHRGSEKSRGHCCSSRR